MKPPTKCQFSKQSGFTLIEIMMVIAIIGILAAIALVSKRSKRRLGILPSLSPPPKTFTKSQTPRLAFLLS